MKIALTTFRNTIIFHLFIYRGRSTFIFSQSDELHFIEYIWARLNSFLMIFLDTCLIYIHKFELYIYINFKAVISTQIYGWVIIRVKVDTSLLKSLSFKDFSFEYLSTLIIFFKNIY